MKGLPLYLQTRSDWEHAYDYAIKHTEARSELISRLLSLKFTKTMKVLKPGTAKAAEKLGPDDFEDVPDPASPFALSGFTDSEIDSMIEKLRR